MIRVGPLITSSTPARRGGNAAVFPEARASAIAGRAAKQMLRRLPRRGRLDEQAAVAIGVAAHQRDLPPLDLLLSPARSLC